MTLRADRFLEGKVRPRVFGVRSFERLDRVLQAVGRSVGRHLHHQAHVEVARRAALRIGHAAPGEAKPLPALAPPGHLEPHRPVRRRHRDGRAPDRLADRDRHLDGEVLAVAPEERVRPDLDDEVEVARRGAAASHTALALHAHARTVALPGRAPPAPTAGAAEAETLERALAAEGEAVPALGPALVLACTRRIEPGLQALQAELVVELALARVREDVVRDRDLLEALLGLLVPRVQVGVMLAGEPAVRLLYLVGARAPLDTENRVEIPLLRHRPRISRRTGSGPCRRRSRAARRRSPCCPTRPGDARP